MTMDPVARPPRHGPEMEIEHHAKDVNATWETFLRAAGSVRLSGPAPSWKFLDKAPGDWLAVDARD